MKMFHWFLGLFFLISISGSQSVEAASPIPAGLESTIESVKKKIQAGASKKEIAAFVTNIVSNRLTFLNHGAHQKDGSLFVNHEIERKVKYFNAWRDKRMIDYNKYKKKIIYNPYYASASATWAWENRMGQCNEGANTAFHILAMAYKSTNEIIPVNLPNHRFILLGDVKNIPNPFSPRDLQKLENTYIIDPWDGKSFSTKKLGRSDLHQYGTGNIIFEGSYRAYKTHYNKFLTYCKKNPVEYQKWLHGVSDTEAEEIVEHKDSMKFMLAQYREEIDALKALKEQIYQKGRASLSKTEYNLGAVRDIQRQLKEYETLILALVDQGKSYCDEARVLHRKIIALSAAMGDSEALVNSKINMAEEKANCKTDEDSIFIKINYQAAEDAFAIMKTTKEAAFDSLVDININLEQNKRSNTQLSRLHDSGQWKEQRRKHEELLKAIPQYLEQLETGLIDTKGFPTKVQELKNKIEDSKQHYTQYFPGSKAEFDSLISEVSSIKLYYVTSIADLDDLLREYQTAQTALDTPTGNNQRIFKGTPPLINCFSDAVSKEIMDKIDEAFLRGRLVLKTSDYLRDGCKVKVAVQEPAKDSDGSPPTPPVDKGGLTPDPANGSGKDTSSNTMGGLVIAGSAEVMAGDGVTYTATDRAGKIYTEGSFVWSVNDRSVVSLGESGNPVSGVAYKAGTFVLMLKYDGATVFLDVRIKEKKNSLFGTTGGEDSQTGQGDLFGTTGGETITDNTPEVTTIDCSHIPGSTAVQGNCICTGGLILSPSRGRCISCGEYYQAAKNAVAKGALNAAQSIVNEASECTSWTAQVQGSINNARQEQVCNNIAANMQAACQSNNARAIHGFMGEANQKKCHIDDGLWQWGNTLIAEYDQRIKDQRAAQQQQQQAQAQRPQQPQNQTNWMDVFNEVVKGVQGVQQGSRKPPKNTSTYSSGSKPLPTADSIWQSRQMPTAGTTFPGAGTWGGSGNTTQPQKNKPSKSTEKKNAPYCNGHTIYCKRNGVPTGLSNGMEERCSADKNGDGFCDFCGKRFPTFYEHSSLWSIFKDKNDECRTSPW